MGLCFEHWMQGQFKDRAASLAGMICTLSFLARQASHFEILSVFVSNLAILSENLISTYRKTWISVTCSWVHHPRLIRWIVVNGQVVKDRISTGFKYYPRCLAPHIDYPTQQLWLWCHYKTMRIEGNMLCEIGVIKGLGMIIQSCSPPCWAYSIKLSICDPKTRW